MDMKKKCSTWMPICAAAVTVFGGAIVAAPVHADGGCIPGDQAGMVPRNARPGDNVCAPADVAATVQQENANKADGYAGGGAYGDLTCKSGLVWREAFDGDAVCVSPERRQTTFQENANAGVGNTGGLKPQTAPPGGSAATGGPDGALLSAVNDARLHPENYPPLDADKSKAVLTACTNALGDSGALDNVASTHNQYLAGKPGQMVNTFPNMHRNPPPDGVISWAPSQDPPDSRQGPIQQAGYNMRGEIVATGQGSEAEAVAYWMQHDAASNWGHRNNILNCGYTDAGAAHHTGGDLGNYWTVDLGAH
jgi:hypothetical protein